MGSHCYSDGIQSVCVAFVYQKCHCCQETLTEDVKNQKN